MKLISWNLLHRDGAVLGEVARLIETHRPDLLLMQEVTEAFAGLKSLVGGHFLREPLPGRVHGLAMWVPLPMARPPLVFRLPSGAFVRRVCQIAEIGGIGVANVHLSHGQLLNRRQLRAIAARLPVRGAIVGDFNMVGPAWVPGFQDAGPRLRTHRMSELVPLRLDRCLLRGVACPEAQVLDRGGSDHHPIVMRLMNL